MATLYRHRVQGFRLREDAYQRRCDQHEFSPDEFEAVDEDAPSPPQAQSDDGATATASIAPEVSNPPSVVDPSAEEPVTEPATRAPRKRRW